MTRPQALSTRLVENDRVIVTEWRFAPGGETGWHRHAYDYLVVPLTNGKLLLENQGSEAHAELKIGAPYYRQAGVEHNVVNDNAHEFVFIEIELKP